MNRPFTTLFLLQSLDGKISTGDVDELDVDKDFLRITGLKDGLSQYYELEKRTDLVSFNSGRVLAKIGVNEQPLEEVEKTPVSFVVVDDKPHLNKNGCEYFAKKSKTFYLITDNKYHPAFALKQQYNNIEILYYKTGIDFPDVFRRLKEEYDIENMTIQTGGTLNSILLRDKLIDKVSIVIAPCLIGGKNTSTSIDGESLHNETDLLKIKALRVTKCETLENSYLHIEGNIINDTIIENTNPSS
ncbi:MAG: dihydrofolate reductase family protein [Chloroflexi bacterium]|nr:dihydrofolate reductase family protein [Chloroflexota bacterium]